MGQQERAEFDQMINMAWLAFESNLNALWTFTDNISRCADEIDQHRVKKAAVEMAEILGGDAETIEAELLQFTPSLDDMELYPDLRNNPDAREFIKAFKEGEFQQRILGWASENPRKSHRLAAIMFEYILNPPISGIVLRRNVLVSLASGLEILMTSLLAAYNFYNYSLSLSIADRDSRLEKAQADANIPGLENILKQIQKTGAEVDFSKANISTIRIKELFARRNKIVHTDGRIDKRYMELPVEYRASGAEIGRILLVPDNYLQRMLHDVTLFGLLLTQVCWRTWQPTAHLKGPDNAWKWFIGWHIYKEHYDIALNLIESTNILRLPDEIEQLARIDQAAILQRLERGNDAQNILASFPRARSERQKLFWKVYLGLETLLGNKESVQFLMMKYAKENRLTEISPDWIVLTSIKDEPWFEKLFDSRNKGKLPAKADHGKARR